MAEVVCWCCEHYIQFENPKTIENLFIDGRCSLLGICRREDNAVCEEFIMRSGLYTKREIPKYCKNYFSD